jgi:hypothetical protein
MIDDHFVPPLCALFVSEVRSDDLEAAPRLFTLIKRAVLVNAQEQIT